MLKMKINDCNDNSASFEYEHSREIAKNKIIQEHDYKKSCSEIFFRSSYDFIDRRIFSIYFLMQNPVSYMDEYPVK